MLQVISRELKRRNFTHAAAGLHVERAKSASRSGIFSSGASHPPFFFCRDSGSNGSRGFCSNGNFSIDAGTVLSGDRRRGFSSDGGRLFIGYGRRCYSSDVSEQASNDITPVECPPSEALLKYRKIVRVCEILEANPWGPETEKYLKDLDVSFSSDMVIRVIRAASSPSTTLRFFNWLTRNGFEQDAHTYGAMMDVLGEAGSLDDVKYLAEEMRKCALVLDAGLYDKLIHWCVCCGDAMGASSFLDQMKLEGYAMSAMTYTSMFDVFAKEGRYEEAVTLYLQMVEEGVLPSSQTFSLLIRCLLEAGKLEPAQEIFTSLSGLKVKHPMSAFAYLMAAHAKVGNLNLLHSLGKEMRNSCGKPGKIFCIALNSLQREGKMEEADAFAKEVWPELSAEERRLKVQEFGGVSTLNEREKNDLQDDLGQLTSPDKMVRVSLSETARLLETEGFSAVGQVNVDWTADAVYKVLKHFRKPDVSWEFFKWLRSIPGFMHDINNEVLMLRMLVKSSNFSALKELLSELQSRSVAISLEIFNTLIKDCALAKNSRAAMWVYSRMRESSLQPDEETFSSLVHALARGRSPDKASDLCAVMQDVGIKPDVETYTAVIHSLGLSCRSDDAWSVYQKMLAAGLKPNVNTYTALLNMMNLVGDTGFAIKLYKEMNGNGVAPTEATLGIMARIWETSGNSAEAQKLETQRKFLSSKRREDSLQHTYEVLLEGLVEQERSPSLLCLT